MAVIKNSWIEKQKKKREHETAPAFEAAPIDNWLPVSTTKIAKRHTNAARASYTKSLRGVRK